MESSIAVAERGERLMARDGGGTSEKRSGRGVGRERLVVAWSWRGRGMSDDLNNILQCIF